MVIKIAETSSSEEDRNLLLWHLINDKKENNIEREREREGGWEGERERELVMKR